MTSTAPGAASLATASSTEYERLVAASRLSSKRRGRLALETPMGRAFASKSKSDNLTASTLASVKTKRSSRWRPPAVRWIGRQCSRAARRGDLSCCGRNGSRTLIRPAGESTPPGCFRSEPGVSSGKDGSRARRSRRASLANISAASRRRRSQSVGLLRRAETLPCTVSMHADGGGTTRAIVDR